MFHFKFIFYKCHYVVIVTEKKRNLLHFSFCCSMKYGGWQLHFSRHGEASKYKKTRKIRVRLKASSSCSWKWALRLFQGSDVLSDWFMHSSSGFVTKSNTTWKLLLNRKCSGNSGLPSLFLTAKKVMLFQDFWKRLAHGFITGGSKLAAPSDTTSTLCEEAAAFLPTSHQSPFPLCIYSFSSHKSCKLRKVAHRVKLWKKYETL